MAAEKSSGIVLKDIYLLSHFTACQLRLLKQAGSLKKDTFILKRSLTFLGGMRLNHIVV